METPPARLTGLGTVGDFFDTYQFADPLTVAPDWANEITACDNILEASNRCRVDFATRNDQPDDLRLIA